MGGWTDVGSGMPRGDAAWSTLTSCSFSLPLSRVAVPLLSRSCFFTSRHLALAYSTVLRFLLALVLSLSLSLRLGGLARSRAGGVSRRALWWLLRWLLASLESSQESVPPEGQGTPSGTGSPPSPPLSISPPPPLPLPLLLTAPRTAASPPYAPSGSYLRVLLIFSYYRRGHVGTFPAHTRESSLYVHGVRVHLGVHRIPPPSRLALSAVPYATLARPPRRFSPGTPICEHIITEARGNRGRDRERVSRGLSREGAKTRDETHTRSPRRSDEENAKASERTRKGV